MAGRDNGAGDDKGKGAGTGAGTGADWSAVDTDFWHVSKGGSEKRRVVLQIDLGVGSPATVRLCYQPL